ncbi:MAG: hypothetical protein RML57_08715, partial [Acidobacteriota bacterium]|nr:hypothetical protein [Acidobacteriota bacterium]
HIESPADRITHLHRLRTLQRETGGFTEFIPLPFIAAKSPAGAAPSGGARLTTTTYCTRLPLRACSWGATSRTCNWAGSSAVLAVAQRSLPVRRGRHQQLLEEEEISNRAGSRFGSYIRPSVSQPPSGKSV